MCRLFFVDKSWACGVFYLLTKTTQRLELSAKFSSKKKKGMKLGLSFPSPEDWLCDRVPGDIDVVTSVSPNDASPATSLAANSQRCGLQCNV